MDLSAVVSIHVEIVIDRQFRFTRCREDSHSLCGSTQAAVQGIIAGMRTDALERTSNTA